MRLVIEVHHTVKLDPSLTDLLKALFPNAKTIEDLTSQVKGQTEKLKEAVGENQSTS